MVTSDLENYMNQYYSWNESFQEYDYDEDALIISNGCSFTAERGDENVIKTISKRFSLYQPIKGKIGYRNFALDGKSNSTIINDLFRHIKKGNLKNRIVVLQLTLPWRFGTYSAYHKKQINFQPKNKLQLPENPYSNKFEFLKKETWISEFLNKSGVDKLFNSVSKKLNIFYQTYLEYLFDEYEHIHETLNRVEMFIEWNKQYNNIVIPIWWSVVPNEHSGEILKRFKELNFFNHDGEYSILNLTLQKGWNISDSDNHLNQKGHEELGTMIFSFIINNYIKKILKKKENLDIKIYQLETLISKIYVDEKDKLTDEKLEELIEKKELEKQKIISKKELEEETKRIKQEMKQQILKVKTQLQHQSKTIEESELENLQLRNEFEQKILEYKNQINFLNSEIEDRNDKIKNQALVEQTLNSKLKDAAKLEEEYKKLIKRPII